MKQCEIMKVTKKEPNEFSLFFGAVSVNESFIYWRHEDETRLWSGDSTAYQSN